MIDIRMNSYSSKDNKYYPSRKGITVPQKIVLPLYNAILELLPMAEVELDKPTVTVDTWERKPGYDVRLNIVSWEGKMYIDIREYISKPTSDGYTGYTPKGIRIPYDCKDMFVAQLYGGYEKLLKLDEEFGPMAEFGKGKMAVADPKMVREG
jgi:hypothetical protein